MARGQRPEDVARRFSKHVGPKDLVVWAHDYERQSAAEFLAKYGAAPRRSRSTPKPALSLRDTAIAARNEEHRLEVLDRQLEQQLDEVRREKKDVEELLGFLERKRAAEPPI